MSARLVAGPRALEAKEGAPSPFADPQARQNLAALIALLQRRASDAKLVVRKSALQVDPLSNYTPPPPPPRGPPRCDSEGRLQALEAVLGAVDSASDPASLPRAASPSPARRGASTLLLAEDLQVTLLGLPY
jgi:hypothetical protein